MCSRSLWRALCPLLCAPQKNASTLLQADVQFQDSVLGGMHGGRRASEAEIVSCFWPLPVNIYNSALPMTKISGSFKHRSFSYRHHGLLSVLPSRKKTPNRTLNRVGIDLPSNQSRIRASFRRARFRRALRQNNAETIRLGKYHFTI